MSRLPPEGIRRFLRRHDEQNFKTITGAARKGDLFIVRCVRKSDQKEVTLLCATNSLPAGKLVPLATLIEPEEEFEHPYYEFE